MQSYIKAISVYFPADVLTNDTISEKFPEWNSEKIHNKIGVSNRFIAHQDEFTSHMATKALERLFTEHNIDKQSIDYLIVCTQTPDYLLPTTACLVQSRVGLSTHCGAIDINQGCSGYIYGLSLAASLVSSGNFKNVVLVTADTYSKIIHPTDKGNLSIFGDAASATLISTEGNYRIGKFTLGTDGEGAENIILKNRGILNNYSGNENDLDNYLEMKGNKVFNFIVKYVPPIIEENLRVNNLSTECTDLYVFHQANTHILKKVREEIGIPSERFVLEMENCGNTVSSSIPIAFKQYLAKNPNCTAKSIQMAGFGVGYSWGAVCVFNDK